MKITKLDAYDYEIIDGRIHIYLSGGVNDPDLVDIMSEIHRSNGRIYVEGHRFLYLDKYNITTEEGRTFIELEVTVVEK